eukprot:1195548-Prorocentrum_minimum.AAC.4
MHVAACPGASYNNARSSVEEQGGHAMLMRRKNVHTICPSYEMSYIMTVTCRKVDSRQSKVGSVMPAKVDSWVDLARWSRATVGSTVRDEVDC